MIKKGDKNSVERLGILPEYPSGRKWVDLGSENKQSHCSSQYSLGVWVLERAQAWEGCLWWSPLKRLRRLEDKKVHKIRKHYCFAMNGIRKI